ncbi:MAG: class I SAM-dependent methyltransferase [Pseudomonadota bacterium]
MGEEKSAWSNYWRGRTAGASGEVFGEVGIERSEELAEFWSSYFAGVRSGRILDLACGAGSALKHVPAGHGGILVGADISADAIEQALSNVSPMVGVVSSADALPFADASFDFIVSQFGFEYADAKRAAAEVARVLAPGGVFTSVSHMADGAIAAECRRHLDTIESIEGSGFVEASKTLFSAVSDRESGRGHIDQVAMDEALSAFKVANAAMLALRTDNPLAAHLHSGASQLYDRRANYALADIHGWLDAMAAEIAAYRLRMQGMINAALTREKAEQIIAIISPGGAGSVEPFELRGEAAAYVLRGPA